MKSVQVIDGAMNCSYDIFGSSDLLFEFIFPAGKDIAFIEDLRSAGIPAEIEVEFANMWARPLNKKSIRGIDGTLFYELHEKSKYYPNRLESDLDLIGRGFRLDQAGSLD